MITSKKLMDNAVLIARLTFKGRYDSGVCYVEYDAYIKNPQTFKDKLLKTVNTGWSGDCIDVDYWLADIDNKILIQPVARICSDVIMG